MCNIFELKEGEKKTNTTKSTNDGNRIGVSLVLKTRTDDIKSIIFLQKPFFPQLSSFMYKRRAGKRIFVSSRETRTQQDTLPPNFPSFPFHSFPVPPTAYRIDIVSYYITSQRIQSIPCIYPVLHQIQTRLAIHPSIYPSIYLFSLSSRAGRLAGWRNVTPM